MEGHSSQRCYLPPSPCSHWRAPPRRTSYIPTNSTKSFTGSASTGGPISSLVQRVALNQENGNVYVLDQHSGHADISQFNSNGEPQSWSGLGATNTIELAGPISGNLLYENDLLFDNTGHDFGLFVLGPQAAGGTRVASYNADGTIRLPGFTSLGGNPCGLGLSAEGVLYVGGQFPTMWSGETGELVHPPGFEGPLSEQQVCHITFDNENDAWTNKVTPEGAQPGLYKFGNPNELYVCCEDGFGDKSKLHVSYVPTQYSAVDPGSGDIFAIEEEKQISEFTAAGQPVETFGLGAIGGSLGVAVNGTTHEVYVDLEHGHSAGRHLQTWDAVHGSGRDDGHRRSPGRNLRRPQRRDQCGRSCHNRMQIRMGHDDAIPERHRPLRRGRRLHRELRQSRCPTKSKI